MARRKFLVDEFSSADVIQISIGRPSTKGRMCWKVPILDSFISVKGILVYT